MSSLHSSTLLDTLDDLFLVFDETGTALDWNQTAVTVTGYSDEELSEMTPTEFFDVEDSDRVMAAVAEVLETGDATVEAALVTAEGERVPHEFKAHRVTESDTVAFVGIGRDISDRKAAERERTEILDRMSDAFFAVDSEWQLTYANEMAERLLSDAIGEDLTAEELAGENLWELIPQAIDTVFYEKYHEAMATQEPVEFEEYYAPMDRWFDVQVYPSETGLSIYLYDVTDRRRQHDALQHREQVLREMYDIIADRDLPFTEQVDALLELGREELETAYGTLSKIEGDEYVFEVVDADDDSIEAGDVVPLSATNCELAASSEQTLVLGDVARDAPDQTDRAGYTEWGISCYIGGPVFVDDGVYGTFCFYDTEPREGQFSEWEVTLVDLMSRWVGYELQRQQANEQLRRQNEKLERFASIVSHDLRNPLNVLAGRLKLAEETGDQEEFDQCREALDRMETLIDDLLTLARSGESIEDTEAVALGTIVEECWQTVATESATLQVDTQQTIQADRTRLQQLLENLLRNAIEHGGADVTITVGPLEDGFYVADDGPGISDDDREDVFESGYSTSKDGTGFGLAIVTEIADAHGWEVRVIESEDGGARFEFTGVPVE